MSPLMKNMALWLVIILSMILLFGIFSQSQTGRKELNFSEFLARVEQGEVAEVEALSPDQAADEGKKSHAGHEGSGGPAGLAARSGGRHA